MRAERHAPAAVDADERVAGGVEIDSVHGAGLGAFSTADAEVLFDDDAAVLALRVGTRGAGMRTGRRVAGDAGPCLKTGGKPSG